jgi:hypothetical protein
MKEAQSKTEKAGALFDKMRGFIGEIPFESGNLKVGLLGFSNPKFHNTGILELGIKFKDSDKKIDPSKDSIDSLSDTIDFAAKKFGAIFESGWKESSKQSHYSYQQTYEWK